MHSRIAPAPKESKEPGGKPDVQFQQVNRAAERFNLLIEFPRHSSKSAEFEHVPAAVELTVKFQCPHFGAAPVHDAENMQDPELRSGLVAHGSRTTCSSFP